MRYFFRFSAVLVFAFLYVGAGTKEIQLTEGIQPGNLAPEINLQGIDTKGKDYVLVQFWAAYNPQSRVENTQMHNVIASLKTDKIGLVSISMDENPAVFKGVLKTDRLDESTQWNEPAGRDSQLFKKYRLKSGFANFLVDANGVIVAKNLSPSDIRKKFNS
ncbi:MAG: hypothetical protein LBG77_05905 [Dysgonamonadaceae bacterium]|jgi:hypothetical protein|nr:hypothetical protein [Dysgonamonadaceae bacterium]